MKKMLVALCVIFSLTACDENNSRKIDVSSQEKYSQSISQISKELSIDKQSEFAIALSKITSEVAIEAQGDPEKLLNLLKDRLNGKTADEVISLKK